MKITISDDKTIQLEEVFNPIVLKTRAGEEIIISMRDSGFEFKYQEKWYSAQNGIITDIDKPNRKKYSLSENEIFKKLETPDLIKMEEQLDKSLKSETTESLTDFFIHKAAKEYADEMILNDDCTSWSSLYNSFKEGAKWLRTKLNKI